jgi:nucleoside-diphosphate-sugar epimerase
MRFDLFVNELVLGAVTKGYYVMYEPDAKRTFLNVNDAVDGIIFTINNSENMVGSIFNLGDESQNYSKREIASIVSSKINYLLHIAEFAKDKDQRDYLVSYEKISNLGYNSKIDIHQSISDLINLSKIWVENSVYRNA